MTRTCPWEGILTQGGTTPTQDHSPTNSAQQEASGHDNGAHKDVSEFLKSAFQCEPILQTRKLRLQTTVALRLWP